MFYWCLLLQDMSMSYFITFKRREVNTKMNIFLLEIICTVNSKKNDTYVSGS